MLKDSDGLRTPRTAPWYLPPCVIQLLRIWWVSSLFSFRLLQDNSPCYTHFRFLPYPQAPHQISLCVVSLPKSPSHPFPSHGPLGLRLECSWSPAACPSLRSPLPTVSRVKAVHLLLSLTVPLLHMQYRNHTVLPKPAAISTENTFPPLYSESCWFLEWQLSTSSPGKIVSRQQAGPSDCEASGFLPVCSQAYFPHCASTPCDNKTHIHLGHLVPMPSMTLALLVNSQ